MSAWLSSFRVQLGGLILLTVANFGLGVLLTREAARQAETRLMKRLRDFLKDKLGDLGAIEIALGAFKLCTCVGQLVPGLVA